MPYLAFKRGLRTNLELENQELIIACSPSYCGGLWSMTNKQHWRSAMKIYIYKTAKKRIEKSKAKGNWAATFNSDGGMDYLLGATVGVY